MNGLDIRQDDPALKQKQVTHFVLRPGGAMDLDFDKPKEDPESTDQSPRKFPYEFDLDIRTISGVEGADEKLERPLVQNFLQTKINLTCVNILLIKKFKNSNNTFNKFA